MQEKQKKKERQLGNYAVTTTDRSPQSTCSQWLMGTLNTHSAELCL